MSREIKFRAWDKKRKEMLPVKFMDFSEWWVSCDPTYGKASPLEYGERNSFANKETDRHILMQYTGLHDKNSKEIYEGDVCDDARGFRFVVIWEDNARFLGRGIGKQKEYIRYVGQEPAVKVIGNIYDNPELLEG